MRSIQLHSLSVFVGLAAIARAQNTVIVSTSGSSSAISSDGAFVAFTSAGHVLAFDRLAGVSEFVSVSSTGVAGNGASDHAAISSDGRFVAFDSVASNLVPNDTNGTLDVFVRDRLAATTVRVSVSSSGTQSTGWNPSISGDGSLVAFESYAGNLVSPPALGSRNVFIHNCTTGATTLASFGLPPDPPTTTHSDPVISSDGRFVAYTSMPHGGWLEVNRFDIAANTMQGVANNSVSFPLWGNSNYDLPSLSSDGRFVAFRIANPSACPLTVTCDMNPGSYEVVSIAPSGMPACGLAQAIAISSDGRFVAFTSASPDLNGGTPAPYAYVRDRQSSTTTRVSIDPQGATTTVFMGDLAISGSGRFVVFRASTGELELRDTLACPDVSAYCTSATTTHGCVPVISGTGYASATRPNGFVLRVDQVEGQRVGVLFYGTAPTAQVWGLGSSSYLCILYPVQRLGAMPSGGTANACDGVLATDWNDWRATNFVALGSPFTAGEQFYAQGWFRDGGAVKGTNLSNALHFTLCD